MFCNGQCVNEETGERCGLFWTVTGENETGEKFEREDCGFMALVGELMEIKVRLQGIQQATESNRNVGADVGVAVAQTFREGFNKLAKAQLIRDNPALAILDD